MQCALGHVVVSVLWRFSGECICRFQLVGLKVYVHRFGGDCFVEVECGSESAWRYGGESTMVIVLVYISSLSPFLVYLYGRLRCMISSSYLGEPKQRCSVCNGR